MQRLYIVTGACGHLGNTLVKKLIAQGERVRGLVLPNESTLPLDGVDIELVKGDVRDKASLKPLFDNDRQNEVIVIHAAGIVTVASKYVKNVVDVNVMGTKNIVEMCLENNVTKLVYISSVHALPELPGKHVISEINSFNPDAVVGLYAKTKAQATQIVLDSCKQGLNAVVVHPSGIIGPNDYGNGHLTQMIIDYLNGGLTASIKGGYDFVDVRDVANGIIAAIKHGRSGECYILSNRFFTVIELLNQLHEISGKRKIKTILPKWFAKISAPLAEFYYKLLRQSPLFTSYTLYTLYSNSSFSHEKADKELGYTARDMKSTLTDTIDFLRQQGRIKTS
jgi:dihydroflavonol-4-reductase